jgi:hypothetical protein
LLAALDCCGAAQVCGEAEVWGDGVVPLPTAHLEGAINIDLEGVYHSPLGASEVRSYRMRCTALTLTAQFDTSSASCIVVPHRTIHVCCGCVRD